MSTGTNQNIDIQTTRTDKTVAKPVEGDQAGRVEAAGAKPGRRAGPRAGAGVGAEGATDGQRGLEQPRRQALTRATLWPCSISRSRPPSSPGTGKK